MSGYSRGQGVIAEKVQPTCLTPNKRRFLSKVAAEIAQQEQHKVWLKDGIKVEKYLCGCEGWHLAWDLTTKQIENFEQRKVRK